MNKEPERGSVPAPRPRRSEMLYDSSNIQLDYPRNIVDTPSLAQSLAPGTGD
jgi:hypothetical protein